MRYQKPGLISLARVNTSHASCCSGTNPSELACTVGPKISVGGCNDGCGANNHCNTGSDAGKTGQQNQGCAPGISAQTTSFCTTGPGFDLPGSGCGMGNSAAGCLVGNSPTYT